MKYTKYKKVTESLVFVIMMIGEIKQIHNIEHQEAILQMVKHVDLILMVLLMM
jgi:hypothetical protein